MRWAGCGAGTRHRALGDAEDTLAVVRHALHETVREGRQAQVLALAEAIGGAGEGGQRSPASGAPAGATEASPEARGASPPRRTDPSPDPNRVELAALLHRLAAGMTGHPAGAAPRRVPAAPDLELARRLEDGPVLEVEHPGLLEALAWAARDRAARTGCSVALALPWRRLRDAAQATGLEVLVPASRVVCAARWRRIQGQLALTTDTAHAAAAYLGAWLDRAGGADAALLSGWMLGRFPELGLFAAAARCGGQGCDDEACDVRRSERAADAPVFLVPHGLGLDWLERNVPGLQLVFADAQLLVEAARRRSSFVLDAHQALAFADAVDQASASSIGTGPFRACAEALEATLASEQEALTRVEATGGHVTPRLRVRDDVSALGHELALLLADLRELPGPVAEAVRREGRELAALIGRFITAPPPGMEQIVPAGWRVPGLLLRTAPEVLATTLGVQLRRAAEATGARLVSTLHSPAPHGWLAPLGLGGAPVPQLGGPPPHGPVVHLVREPSPALASRLVELARLAGEAGVAVVAEDLTLASAALLPALRAARVPMRVAGGAARGGVLLSAWRSAAAPAARVLVMTGAPRPSEVRALLLLASGVEHAVLALHQPAPVERWAAPLAGFELREARWGDLLAALGARGVPAAPPSASPASPDCRSALHQLP